MSCKDIGPCIPWTGAIGRNGYGYEHAKDPLCSSQLAHRRAFRHAYGWLPDGPLDHICHTRDEACPGGYKCLHRRCCNPSHLEPVTTRENLRRGRGFVGERARQTACVNGHDFTPENTYIRKNGTRLCRHCGRDQQKKRMQRPEVRAEKAARSRRYYHRKKNAKQAIRTDWVTAEQRLGL